MDFLPLAFCNVMLANDPTVLDQFFRIVTEFGSDSFFMLVIMPIFWCVNKKFGFRLLMLVTLVAYTTTVLKNLFRIPRPAQDTAWSVEKSYAFPSGHATGSTTFWVYAMVMLRRGWLVIVGIVIIILVAFSRVYLGVHYPTDVYAGIALGVGCVAVFMVFDPRVTKMVRKLSLTQKLLIGALIPLLLVIYGSLFFETDEYGVSLGAALMGIVLGYILENEYLNFTVDVPVRNKVFRAIFGLFIAWTAYFGLGMVLPTSITTTFFTSWLGGFCVTFIVPWLFLKIEN